MNRIIFSKQAENSLNDAFSFYESKQPDLGYNFIEAVENCLEKIISNPRLYPCKKFDFREALLKDYPFLCSILNSKQFHSCSRCFPYFPTP